MSWVRGVSVYSEMTIQNTQSTPTCYKVSEELFVLCGLHSRVSTPQPRPLQMKCTDNSQFRVRPPMNFIDQGGSASVKVYCSRKLGPFVWTPLARQHHECVTVYRILYLPYLQRLPCPV